MLHCHSRFTLLLIASVFVFSSDSFAQVKFGAIGDSLLDEHFDQEEFGTNLGYSKNGLELMVDAGKADFGSVGSWGGTRNDGYEYNWALAGSTTASLIADGQHLNLASQIPTSGITKAVMVVGSNDLFPFPPGSNSNYENIYDGNATQAQIDLIAGQAVNNVVLAAQTLKNTGVDLIVATAPDYGISPFTKNFYTDPVRRERVDDVIEAWNFEAVHRLRNQVQVPVVDMYSLTKDIWGDHGSENSTFQLGGVMLDLNGTGGVDLADVLDGSYNPMDVTSDTVDAFVHDGIHPNNAIGGIFANLFMTAFNDEYQDNFTLFSEQEILANAGPVLGGMYTTDTFTASLGGNGYSDYVYSAVPEPASAVWVLFGTGIALSTRRRRRDEATNSN